MLKKLIFCLTLHLLLPYSHACLSRSKSTQALLETEPSNILEDSSSSNENCKLNLGNPDSSYLALFTDSNQNRFYPICDESSSNSKDPKPVVIQTNGRESFEASCTNSSNFLKNSQKNEIKISCTNGRYTTSGKEIVGADLNCDRKSKEILTINGTCPDSYTKVDIGFGTQSRNISLITVCHNQKTDETVVAMHTIYGPSFDTADVSNNRPSFKEAQFYKAISANTAYTQSSQKETIKKLVGSSTLADTYINPSDSLYLARGHLAPDGDFIYEYEQNATYYFINVSPQWQTINNGNWKALEASARKIAKNNKSTLRIWTGVKDILELKNNNGQLVEIYLIEDSKGLYHIPVPKLSWKVLHDVGRNLAVAVVMVNNPHNQGVTSAEIICPDICDQIKWVTWDTKNIRKGYTYCCTVEELRKAVGPDVPDLGNVQLLNEAMRISKRKTRNFIIRKGPEMVKGSIVGPKNTQR